MGARFSNFLLQTLLVLFRKRPKKSRRLLVIGTTSERTILKQMGLVTDGEIAVPAVSGLDELNQILLSVKAFDDVTRERAVRDLQERTQTRDVKVGIKTILSTLETCVQRDQDIDEAANNFIDLLSEHIAENVPAEPSDFR
jgi:vesicle-fusing ATPase